MVSFFPRYNKNQILEVLSAALEPISVDTVFSILLMSAVHRDKILARLSSIFVTVRGTFVVSNGFAHGTVTVPSFAILLCPREHHCTV